MKSQTIKTLYILFFVLAQSACSGTYGIFDLDHNESAGESAGKSDKPLKYNDNFLSSGTITMSFPINSEVVLAYGSTSEAGINKTGINNEKINNKISPGSAPSLRFAPIVGFFPPTASFNPADNELWIEIDSSTKELRVFKGTDQIKKLKGEGEVTLAPGEYPLQHKQKNPLWYAPDEYFEKRLLKVPPRGDTFRYRRGALGTYAIYPTTSFPIHSGPFWSDEIGGFKVSEADLAAIFLMIKPGTPVIVR